MSQLRNRRKDETRGRKHTENTYDMWVRTLSVVVWVYKTSPEWHKTFYTLFAPHNGESFHNFSRSTPESFFFLRPSKVLQTKLTHRSVYSVLWWVCDESVANMNPFGGSVTFSRSFLLRAILIRYRCRRRRAEDEALALTPHSVLLVVFGWKRLLWKQYLKHRKACPTKNDHTTMTMMFWRGVVKHGNSPKTHSQTITKKSHTISKSHTQSQKKNHT